MIPERMKRVREPLLERLEGVVAAVGDGLVILASGEGASWIGGLHLLDRAALGLAPVDLDQPSVGAAEGDRMVLGDDPARLLGAGQR